MSSDPSYGTTGFFSYLWVKRHPVYDHTNIVQLTDDTGQIVLTDDSGQNILTTESASLRLIRWI